MYTFFAPLEPKSGVVQEMLVVPSPVQSVSSDIRSYESSSRDNLQSPFSSKSNVMVWVESVMVDELAGLKLDGAGGMVSRVYDNASLVAAVSLFEYKVSLQAI